jgi:hypothetical protein
MGLVANGGADATLTYTGWKLKDSGSGNMTNFYLELHTTLEVNFKLHQTLCIKNLW